MVRVLQETLIFISILTGLCALGLVTRSIILAFFNESKSVTIYINRSGEQYLDILACIVLWVLSISGMILFLRKTRKAVKDTKGEK